jgi:translation initiation factor 2B subunit (eIF-2B alpha/beta/delta family)
MHMAIVTVGNVGRLLGASPPPDLVALRRSLAEGNPRIARYVASLLPPGARLVTISHSSTVEAALLAAKPVQVYALESLPGGEGHALAAKLDAAVVPDAAMARIVPLVDCALVGVDAFDHAGAILHKVGTLPLALCCAHFHKPFYAAGHSFKLAPVDTATLLADAGPTGANFDRTPAELITALITEQGASPSRGRGGR